MLYVTSIGNIEFAKKQQFQITNYVLIANAAVVAVATSILETGLAPKWRLIICASLTVILGLAVGYGLTFVSRLQSDLARYRARLQRCRARFTEEFAVAFGTERSPDYIKPTHQGDILGVLKASQIAGLVLSAFVMWSSWANK